MIVLKPCRTGYPKSSNRLPGAYLQKLIFGWDLFEGGLCQSLAFSSKVGKKRHNFVNQLNHKITIRLFDKRNLNDDFLHYHHVPFCFFVSSEGK